MTRPALGWGCCAALLLLAGACGSPGRVAQPAPDPPTLYGAPIDAAIPRLALAELLKSPAAHAGETVRTEGVIRRVCQRMGCWMELHEPGSSSALRVPMAGHAFFLPQHVQGKRAAVQGTLQIAKLSDERRRHLEAEGAEATASDVSLAATGVAVQ